VRRPENDQPWMGPLPAEPGCDCHLCRPDPSYDDLDRRTIDAVLQHGWQVMLVSPDAACCSLDHDDLADDDAGAHGPTFAYTLGLGHRLGHPELLMSGLDLGVMHRALNAVATRIMAGLRPVPGDALEDVLAGVPVAVEEVADEGLRDAVTWSGWFHRRKPEALALVWPDRTGIFAWQPGAPAILDELQPRGWRLPIEHRDGLAADPSWDFPVPPDHLTFSCTHVVDHGRAALWAARESDESRGEDWSVHCGGYDHRTDDMRLVHLAHLVRSAPSLRRISDLGMDRQASRTGADAPWSVSPLSD
jgi:hypothetical protein